MTVRTKDERRNRFSPHNLLIPCCIFGVEHRRQKVKTADISLYLVIRFLVRRFLGLALLPSCFFFLNDDVMALKTSERMGGRYRREY